MSEETPDQIAEDAIRLAKLRRGFGAAHRGELSPAQKSVRDAAILASVHARMDEREIAREFGITPRSVRRIAESSRHLESVLSEEPRDIVSRLVAMYELQIVRLARIAADTLERAPAVAVQALRAEQDARERFVQLLGAIGKLPTDLATFRAEDDLLRLARLMADRVMDFEEGRISSAELAETFYSIVNPNRVRALEEGAGDEASNEG